MEVTKRTEYAIRALTELASQEPGIYIQSKEIASRRSIPEKLLPQILAELNRGGLVEGTRGPTGGIRLAVDPESISVLDVLELIEGPLAMNSCLNAETSCKSSESCSLQKVWGQAQDSFKQVLSKASISDLV